MERHTVAEEDGCIYRILFPSLIVHATEWETGWLHAAFESQIRTK